MIFVSHVRILQTVVGGEDKWYLYEAKDLTDASIKIKNVCAGLKEEQLTQAGKTIKPDSVDIVSTNQVLLGLAPVVIGSRLF